MAGDYGDHPRNQHEQQEKALGQGQSQVEAAIDDDPESWQRAQCHACGGHGDWVSEPELQRREFQEELNGWLDDLARHDI